MNTPVKIWINPSVDLSQLSGHIDKNSVEYVRKDAFVEKVLDFFENDLCCYIKAQNFIIDHPRLEQDFIKYMQEETSPLTQASSTPLSGGGRDVDSMENLKWKSNK